MKQLQAIVFGSINMDLAVKVPRLPQKGETLAGNSFSTTGGGKGANQAVALARLGVETALIGRVGDDNFGTTLIENLTKNGVQTEKIKVDNRASTGIAMITVEESGENQIIIVSGANGKMDDSDLSILRELLPFSSYLLLQLEIPLPVVVKAIAIAQSLSIPVILDPAPAHQLPEEIYPSINIITPNLIEISQLANFSVKTIKDVEKAALKLLNKGVENVIVTMGKEGVFCLNKEEKFLVLALDVNVVDTVAAGDAFNAGLTTALIEGHSLKEAVKWGVIVASLSIIKTGAQLSFPTRQEFDTFRQNS